MPFGKNSQHPVAFMGFKDGEEITIIIPHGYFYFRYYSSFTDFKRDFNYM